MDITSFEAKIQKEIDQELHIVPHPVNTDMAGVYWRNIYCCAVPNGEILDEESELYKDAVGNKHRTRQDAEKKIKEKVHRYRNNIDGSADVMTRKFHDLG